jgi:hypothetical protein
VRYQKHLESVLGRSITCGWLPKAKSVLGGSMWVPRVSFRKIVGTENRECLRKIVGAENREFLTKIVGAKNTEFLRKICGWVPEADSVLGRLWVHKTESFLQRL